MSPADGRLLPRTAAGPAERVREPLQERSMRTSALYCSACAITPSRYAVLISGAAAVSYLP
jgi:hypothetical protein